jgi:hypothetical protein
MRLEHPPSRVEVTVTLGTCAYAVGLALATRLWDYDVWGGMVVAPVLVALSLPVLRRVARHDDLGGIYALLVTALLVKLAMAVPRWAVAFVLYDGTADASSYNNSGRVLAPIYRSLSFPFSDQAGGFSTKVLSSMTGGVYALIGPSVIGGFLVFSWIGFWGLLLCYRAGRIAVPDLDARRYAAFVFFLPSMMFWPSSIGKEAVIALGIGLSLYGAAKVFVRQTSGFLPLAAGLGLSLLVRPHIAALLAGGFAVAFLVRPALRRTALSPVTKTVSAVIISAAGLLVIAKAAQSLGIEGGFVQATDELSRRGELTTRGGSAFDAAPIRSPADVPPAVLAVFFRPLPWEAGSAQVLIASLESTGLLLLFVASWRRVAEGLTRLRDPYVLMSVLYLLGFLYAFSQFGNFGILARQRVQALPFLLLFLSFPALPRPARRSSVPPRPAHRSIAT